VPAPSAARCCCSCCRDPGTGRAPAVRRDARAAGPRHGADVLREPAPGAEGAAGAGAAEMRERAGQPWATRALTRSMRGLIPPTCAWAGQCLAAGPVAAPADAGGLGRPRPAGRPRPRTAAGRRRPGRAPAGPRGRRARRHAEAPEPTARAVLALAEDAAAAAVHDRRAPPDLRRVGARPHAVPARSPPEPGGRESLTR
jgi:hypothetical protein